LTDGVQTITNLTANLSFFRFGTGPTGAINAWDIVVVANFAGSIQTTNVPLSDILDVGSGWRLRTTEASILEHQDFGWRSSSRTRDLLYH
jgi:hypothetical protein